MTINVSKTMLKEPLLSYEAKDQLSIPVGGTTNGTSTTSGASSSSTANAAINGAGSSSATNDVSGTFPVKQSSKRTGSSPALRIECIDILRGFTMTIAVFTGARGGKFDNWRLDQIAWAEKAGTAITSFYAWFLSLWICDLSHAVWNGCTSEDIIIPFFHAAMGTGMVMKLKLGRFRTVNDSPTDGSPTSRIEPEAAIFGTAANPIAAGWPLYKILLKRFANLCVIGFILQGHLLVFSPFSGPTLFLEQFVPENAMLLVHYFRIPGILQRYGAVFALVGAIMLATEFSRELRISRKRWVETGDVDAKSSIPTCTFLRNSLLTFMQLLWLCWPTWLSLSTMTGIASYIKWYVPGIPPTEATDDRAVLYREKGIPCEAGSWMRINVPPNANPDIPIADSCNVISRLEHHVWGCSHMYDPAACFEPEGLTTLMTITLNLMGGVHGGLVVRYARTAQFKNIQLRHRFLCMQWTLFSLGYLLIAIFFQFVLEEPINKQMWTVPFACYSGSAASFFLVILYVVKDIWIDDTKDAYRKKVKEEADTGKQRTTFGNGLSSSQNIVDRFFCHPCYCIGRNALLCWILFNKMPDNYVCEMFPEVKTNIGGTEWILCTGGRFNYNPGPLAIISGVLHVIFVSCLCIWLNKRGTFFTI